MMSPEKRRFYIDILMLMEQINSFDKSLCNVGKLLDSFGYRTIVIYGMGEAGRILINMLSGTEIRVSYVIDNNIKVEIASVEQITEEELTGKSNIDAVVVTPLADFCVLEKRICENFDIPVIGMAEVIRMLLEDNRNKRMQI